MTPDNVAWLTLVLEIYSTKDCQHLPSALSILAAVPPVSAWVTAAP